MLADGYLAVEQVHGEIVRMLDGADAGKTFIGKVDIVEDIDIEGDRRSKRVIRFKEGAVPTVASQNRLETSDGKIWLAVRLPGNTYLTVDFELREVAAGKDT